MGCPVLGQAGCTAKDATEVANKTLAKKTKSPGGGEGLGQDPDHPTDAEKLVWKKALVPVHKKMESRFGADILQAIYKETEFDPTKF